MPAAAAPAWPSHRPPLPPDPALAPAVRLLTFQRTHAERSHLRAPSAHASPCTDEQASDHQGAASSRGVHLQSVNPQSLRGTGAPGARPARAAPHATPLNTPKITIVSGYGRTAGSASSCSAASSSSSASPRCPATMSKCVSFRLTDEVRVHARHGGRQALRILRCEGCRRKSTCALARNLCSGSDPEHLCKQRD